MMNTLKLAHRWIGLVLALPLILQAGSGIILAIEPVITEAALPAAQHEPGAELKGVGAIVAAVRARAPDGAVPMLYLPAPGPELAATVRVAPPQRRGEQTEILVNPYTAEVLAVRSAWRGFIGTVHLLHEHLLAPQLGGRSLIGVFGVGLVILGLTGIPLWWPKPGGLRGAVTVSGKARGWRFQRELHGAAGFWMVGMMLLTGATGVTLAFPQFFRGLAGLEAGRGGPPRGGPRGNEAQPAPPADLDAAVAQALSALPGAALEAVRIPLAPGQPVNVTLRLPGSAEGAPNGSVAVDPAGRRVLSVQDPRTQSAAAQALGWSRSLHFGEALGPLWRGLVALSGVALLLFSVTGATMWLLRQRNHRRLERQRRAALEGAVAS